MTRIKVNLSRSRFGAVFLTVAAMIIPGVNLGLDSGVNHNDRVQPGQVLAAAKTYKSKGNQQNTRNMFETCRLKKVTRVEGTQCIYRRQSGGKDVVISNEDPNVPCQRQFQCKQAK